MTDIELTTRVLEHLRRNARIPVHELAERLQRSETDIEAAIQKLETDRTIIGYSALCNEDKLDDQPARAMIEVEVQPQREGGFDPIARRVSKFDEVHSVNLLSGSYDLLLEVRGASLQEVAYFVACKLSPIEGIRATRTHFLLKKYKQAGFIFEEDEDYERLKVVP